MGKKVSSMLLRVSLVVGWVIAVIFGALSQSGVFKTTVTRVAAENQTALTPADWTFYSWVFIYALQGAGVFYALSPWGYKTDKWKTKTVDTVGIWWLLGWACEVLWLILWVINVPATLIISLGLILLSLLFFAIGYGLLLKNVRKKSKKRGRMSPASYIMFYIPTMMFVAWLSVASCISLLTIVSKYESGLELKHYMKVIAICLGAVVTLASILIEALNLSVFYGITMIWTFTGIFVEQEKMTIVKESVIVMLSILCLSTVVSIVLSIVKLARKKDEKEEALTEGQDEDTSSSSSSSSDDEPAQAEAAV